MVFRVSQSWHFRSVQMTAFRTCWRSRSAWPMRATNSSSGVLRRTAGADAARAPRDVSLPVAVPIFRPDRCRLRPVPPPPARPTAAARPPRDRGGDVARRYMWSPGIGARLSSSSHPRGELGSASRLCNSVCLPLPTPEEPPPRFCSEPPSSHRASGPGSPELTDDPTRFPPARPPRPGFTT